jgi:hypothetical protein
MDREPILAAAGYHLGVNVIPADSVAARERVSQLLHDGVSGIVCCSSIYPVVTALLGKVCPVIILGQGAGNAMVASLQAGSGQSSVGSGERSVGSGQRSVGSGQRSVGSGQRSVGIGQRSVGSGQRSVGSGQLTGSS